MAKGDYHPKYHPEPPACPGCSSRSYPLSLSQPDELDAVRLIGVCSNPDCVHFRAFLEFTSRENGEWILVTRTATPPAGPPDDRREVARRKRSRTNPRAEAEVA